MSREEIAEKWLNKALTDLRVAEKLFEISEEPWVIAFHAQQAVKGNPINAGPPGFEPGSSGSEGRRSSPG